MKDNKYQIDYTNFDPDKEYDINNDKIKMSHQRLIGYAKASETMKEHYDTEKGEEHKKKRVDAAVAAAAKWREENPEQDLANKKKAYEVSKENFHAGQKKWREENAEYFEEIRKAAIQAWLDSGYLGSEKHRADAAKGGVLSKKTNIDRGNIGPNSAMSRWKIAKKAKERAEILLAANLPKKFLPGEAAKAFTTKQWGYVRDSGLIIKLEEMGGYHNTQHYYKLNMKAIRKALKQSTNKDDYFGKKS